MNPYTQKIGYILVSGICLVMHNTIIIATDAMGCVLSIAFLISFCFVGLLGYTLHSKISFCAPMSWAGLQRYLLAMSLNVPTAFGVTWLCKDFFVLPMAAAAPLASTFMLIFNFLLSRWAIVRPEKPA